jgi:hypothetical protein
MCIELKDIWVNPIARVPKIKGQNISTSRGLASKI